MATLAVAAIGAGIGWAAVGTAVATQTGWLVGSIVGMLLFPPDPTEQTIEGPRLGELDTQTSEYGAPIARLYGAYRLGGNLIWAQKLKETKHVDEEKTGGKGGGGSKTTTIWYTYSCSWAVALCEGEIDHIKKIWFDSVLVYDGTNYSSGLSADNHTVYKGTATQSPDFRIQADKGTNAPAFRHVAYIVFDDIELELYGNRIPSVSVEVAKVAGRSQPLADVVSDILDRSKIDSSNYDMSAITDSVDGFAITKPMSARSAINPLSTAFQCDFTETDGLIRLLPRTGTVEYDIPEIEIVKVEKIQRTQELELSKSVKVHYANYNNSYNISAQSARRIDCKANQDRSYEFPLAMSDDKAKQLAESLLFNEWMERTEIEFVLSSEYMSLEPSSVVRLTYKGRSSIVRITDLTFCTDNSLECKGTIEHTEAYTSLAQGSDTTDPNNQIIVKSFEQPEMLVLDIPMLDTNYNKAGVYIANNVIDTPWYGANISRSVDGGQTYSYAGTTLKSTPTGLTTSVLADGVTHIPDFTGSVTFTLRSGSISSITDTALYNAGNYILIGDEILQFRDVTDNGGGSYTVSWLLRGRRGTEWATNTHVIGERVVVLGASMAFVGLEYLNYSTIFNSAAMNTFIEDGTEVTGSYPARCLRPLSPTYVETSRDVNDDVTIKWTRRSRDVKGYLKKLSLLEDGEVYQIHIQVGQNLIIKQLMNSEFVYTATDQTTDGLTVGNPIDFKLYQMSAIAGNGIAYEGTTV